MRVDHFDPEDIEVLRQALDCAWADLSAKEQAQIRKSELAEHVLELAAGGERDPVQLQEYAVRKARERAVWQDLAS